MKISNPKPINPPSIWSILISDYSQRTQIVRTLCTQDGVNGVMGSMTTGFSTLLAKVWDFTERGCLVVNRVKTFAGTETILPSSSTTTPLGVVKVAADIVVGIKKIARNNIFFNIYISHII